MSRTVIVVLLLVAVAAVCLGTVLLLFPRVDEVRVNDSVRELELTGRLLLEMEVADLGRLGTVLSELSRRPGLQDLLLQKPADSARLAWLSNLRAEVAVLVAAARAAGPVKDLFLLDPNGTGLVRNIDLHWTAKPPSEHPQVLAAIQRAAGGQIQTLLIVEQGSLARLVVVPITKDARLLGLLLAAFPVDNALAKIRGSELPPQVRFAYLTSAGLVAGSLSADEKTRLEAFLVDHPEVEDRLLSGNRLQPTTLGTGAERFMLVGFPVKPKPTCDPCGLLVLRSISELQRPVHELMLYLFGGAGLLVALLVVVTVLFGGRLARNLKDLEQELLDVAHSGVRRPIRAGGPAIVRSLAELVNQIVASPTAPWEALPAGSQEGLAPASGVEPDPAQPEEPEAGLEEEPETGLDEEPAHAADEVQAVVQGQEAEYYRDLFERFVEAKQGLGQSVDKLQFQRFCRKLVNQASRIQAKHGCKAVRFELKVRDDKVTLLPKISL